MARIRERLPSKKDAITVLMICAFPIFIWSIIHTLVEIPAWILRSDTWDLIGMIAYTQAFALFESVTIWGIFILLSVILPARFFRDRIVAFSAVILFTTTIWFILIHLNDEQISEWHGRQFLFWAFIYGLSILGTYLSVLRFDKLELFINRICDRLGLLSSIYIFIGVSSLVIVFIRNLF